MLVSVAAAQIPARPDTWEPLRFFVGNWEGTGNGQPGVSKTQREYRFVLGNKFLQVGFASKVIGSLEFGFAVRCEAVALPRRSRALTRLGYALGGAFGL